MKTAIASIVQQVQDWSSANRSDRELIQDYLTLRDESSFRLLVERHARIVWESSRRVLGNGPDTEDVFQATFLTLAQNVAQLRYPDRLAGWLFGTALRLARKVARSRIRRTRHEQQAKPKDSPPPTDQLAGNELLRILDEEVEKLPNEYRLPLLLTYWEGLTQEEIAQRLGWSPGSVKGRLERGRKRLAERLRKRDLSLSILLTASVGLNLPESLFARTISLGDLSRKSIIPNTVSKLAGSNSSLTSIVLLGMGLLGIGITTLLGMAQSEGKKPDNPKVEQKEPKNEVRLDALGDPLPEKAIRRFGSNRFNHGDQIWAMTLTPDGSQIVTGGFGSIRWFDSATGKVLKTIGKEFGHIFRLQFSSDGKQLLLLGGMPGSNHIGLVSLYDLQTEKSLWKRTYPKWVRDGAISPDNKKIAITCDVNGLLEFLDTQSGETIQKIPGQFGFTLAFSPDGKSIAVRTDKFVEIRNSTSGEIERALRSDERPFRLAFSPNGKYLAVGTNPNQGIPIDGTGTITLWEVATGKKLPSLSTGKGMISSVVFSPDNQWLASGNTSGTITVWDTAQGKEKGKFQDQRSWIHGLQFSPQSDRLYTGSTSGFVRIWDLASGKAIFDPKNQSAGALGIDESPDRRILLTSGPDGFLRFWDLASGEQKKSYPVHENNIYSARFTASGSQVISAGQDATVRWTDWKSGKEIYRREPDKKTWQTRIALSPDGKLLAVGGVKKILLLDSQTRKEIRSFIGHEGYITELHFSFDGNYLASATHAYSGSDEAGNDWSIRVWSVSSGKQLFKFDGLYPQAVRFTPDGQGISFTSSKQNNNNITSERKIFDFVTGKERPLSSTSVFQKVEHSPEGAWLATADENGIVHIRDSETEEEILSFPNPTRTVYRLLWSKDRRSLFSGHGDDTVVQWDLTPSKEPFPNQIAKEESENLWNQLGSKDPKIAYRAYWQFLQTKNAVSILTSYLKPIQGDDTDKRIAQWIRDLDNKQFTVREEATRQLQALGSRSIHALEQTRRTSDTADMVQRIDKILANLEAPKPDYRFLRSLEILEASNTPEAIELLQTLSKGNPHADVTQRSISALKRLRE